MKILAIGDPHGNIEELKKIDYSGVDLILVPGDLSRADIARRLYFKRVEGNEDISDEDKVKSFEEIHDSLFEVLNFLGKKAPVYFLFGDFDYSKENMEDRYSDLDIDLPDIISEIDKVDNVHPLRDKKIEIGGIVIGGVERFIDTNWVRDFKPNDFDNKMKEAREETDHADNVLKDFGEVDILMCHQPPFGVLDKVDNPNAPKGWNGLNAGSELILDYIKDKKPKYVICGHIHEAQGEEKVGDTTVYNLGHCGHRFIEM